MITNMFDLNINWFDLIINMNKKLLSELKYNSFNKWQYTICIEISGYIEDI